MVRKQLYLDERHERALKQAARELGLSEAEVVRRALDRMLDEGGAGAGSGGDAIAAFLEKADEIARGHGRANRGASREELYDERPRRWSR